MSRPGEIERDSSTLGCGRALVGRASHGRDLDYRTVRIIRGMQSGTDHCRRPNEPHIPAKDSGQYFKIFPMPLQALIESYSVRYRVHFGLLQGVADFLGADLQGHGRGIHGMEAFSVRMIFQRPQSNGIAKSFTTVDVSSE
jgi:hypothetical protein